MAYPKENTKHYDLNIILKCFLKERTNYIGANVRIKLTGIS